MADGSTVAFFEAPELPPEPAPSHPAYDIFRHLAMQVDTTEEVDGWREWLVENGVDVLGPVDHKIVYSIYFHDPNGNRLEITAPVDPDWNNMERTPGVARGVGAGQGDGAPERAGHGNRPQRAHGPAEPPPRRGAADRLTREPNDMDEASIPKIISVDDHVVEPAHVWERQSSMPARRTRPTPGCTRTSSTSTSATSPPPATPRRDDDGARHLRRHASSRITFETDYPHTDSTWPHSRPTVAKLLDGLDAESIHKIVRGNAIDLFELQGFQ